MLIARCPKCGKGGVRTENIDKYHYRESGLDDVWLTGNGVLESECKHCGFKFITILQEQQLLQVIAMGLLMSPASLRGREVRFLRNTCLLTQAQLAALVGKERRESIADWEAQEQPSRDTAWEFFLRAALLTSFTEFIKNEENNHLTKRQREKLNRFNLGFVERFNEFFASPHAPRLEIIKSSEKADWRPEALAA